MFTKSNDNFSIYYDVVGSGPVILLLHGFGNDHTMWTETGWTVKLKREFTVVTMDFRGCGESDKPENTNAYSLEAHCLDIDKVLETVNGRTPIIWGWSLGATIAMHYAAKRHLKATIACGSYFAVSYTHLTLPTN